MHQVQNAGGGSSSNSHRRVVLEDVVVRPEASETIDLLLANVAILAMVVQERNSARVYWKGRFNCALLLIL
jgi:accessory colonization factor AcfC